MPEAASFEKLPIDMRNTIVEFLSMETLKTLRETSKTMKTSADLYIKKLLDKKEIFDRGMRVVTEQDVSKLLLGLGSGEYTTSPPPEGKLLKELQKQAADDRGDWTRATDEARLIAWEWLHLSEEAESGSTDALNKLNLANHAFGWFDTNGYLHNEDGKPYEYVDPSADLMTRANAWANAFGVLMPPAP
jgi:hypothetical protein